MISLSVACLAGILRVNRVPLSESLKHWIFYVIKAHVASLRHKKEKAFTDSENASRIVSVGSPKQHLQYFALDIFQLCLVNDIQIDAQSIPRDANVRADLLSRFVDKDDWSLNYEIFVQLNSRWGPHSVDRFASHYKTAEQKREEQWKEKRARRRQRAETDTAPLDDNVFICSNCNRVCRSRIGLYSHIRHCSSTTDWHLRVQTPLSPETDGC